MINFFITVYFFLAITATVCAMNSCQLRSRFLSGFTRLERITNVELIIDPAIIYERLLN